MPFLDDLDAGPTHDQGAGEVGTLLSDVAPESVEWLWFGRIPLGKLTVLDGDPGLGKSTLTLDLAARVSRGAALPDDKLRVEPAGVVLLSAEDDLADMIRPRLDAAGADVTRILALDQIPDGDEWRTPSLPDDTDWLRAAILRVGARFVVIDPLMAFLDGAIDAHKDQQVRRGLHRLALLAAETRAAIVVVRHLNKTASGNPLYRGGGSIGIVGAARSGLVVGRDPSDQNRRVLASTKCNLAAEPRSIAFHLETGGDASLVVWDGESGFDASAILALPDDEARNAREEAMAFLREVLADGPLGASEVKRLARAADIAERTLARAKRELKVASKQRGQHAGWVWFLPGTDGSAPHQDGDNLALWHSSDTHNNNVS